VVGATVTARGFSLGLRSVVGAGITDMRHPDAHQGKSGGGCQVGCWGDVQGLCKGRRTMAFTSLFLIAMFGIIAAGVAFRPSTKEKPSARRQETPVAPSGDRVIA
jgi:hypothetical protein